MPVTSASRALAAALVAGAAVVLVLIGATPAQASCASDSPLVSPYRFNGVVTRTELADRVAFVRTDDGRDVVVHGTEMLQEDGATSVDRSYLVGHRYDFHPVNDSSPYQDNICTATTDLGLADPTAPQPGDQPGDQLVGEDAEGPPPWIRPAAVGGIALLGIGLVLLLRRGRAEPPDDDPPVDA